MEHDLHWPDVVTAVPLPSDAVITRQGSWGTSLLRELFGTILPALLLAIGINTFIAQPTRVDGASMEPTLHTDERLIIEKISYRLQAPTRGDVVVLRIPGRAHEPLIKRVVALPGDVVAIHGGRVYIDGAPLDEPYLTQPTTGDLAAQVVPDGHLFVLGDNRASSNDSRVFGMVPFSNIIGHAWLTYWPLERLGTVE